MKTNVVSTRFLSSSLAGGSAATIHPRWLAGSRLLWFLIALNSVVTFAWMVYLTRQFSDNLPLRVAEGLRDLGWTNETFFWFHASLMALSFVCYFAIGVFIFVVRPKDRMAWFASVLLIAYGGEIAYPLAVEFLGGFANSPLLFRMSYLMNNLFSWGILGAFLALFPDGRFVPGWSRFIALFGFLFSFGFGFFPSQFSAPEGLLFAVVIGGGLLLFVGSLYAQVWRYRRHSSQLERQQTKWLIYALALIVMLVFLASTMIYLLLPPEQVSRATSVAADLLYFLANLTFVLLPLSIGIAIVRYRLWDIDIIIRKTLTYAMVVALLALVYFGSVILLQQMFASLTGARSEVVTVLSTLAIAALFVPLRNKIQEVIDRRFYRKKYDAQQVLQDFAETVRDETDLEKLTGRLIEVVDETMQPTSVNVWLRNREHKR
jgi:hypothetical protein